MKGFHQGFSVVSDLVEQCKPDISLPGALAYFRQTAHVR